MSVGPFWNFFLKNVVQLLISFATIIHYYSRNGEGSTQDTPVLFGADSLLLLLEFVYSVIISAGRLFFFVIY